MAGVALLKIQDEWKGVERRILLRIQPEAATVITSGKDEKLREEFA